MNATEERTARALLLLTCLLVTLLAAACRSEASQGAGEPAFKLPQIGQTNAVTGTIAYPADAPLPEGAVLKVQLEDVTLIDASSITVVVQEIPNPGPSPVDFRVEYDSKAIERGNTYGLQVVILDAEGNLLFINDTAYDVITQGNPKRVDMVLVKVN